MAVVLHQNLRLCFFAHYDKDSLIDDYVVYYIRSLKEICDEIVFISVSNIPEIEQTKLDGLIIKFINRENLGYDFGSWRVGFEYIGFENLEKYDEIVVCNDSCYGPIVPFTKIFDDMNKKQDLGAWSITSSHSVQFHMQSYFMVFRKQVLSQTWFQNFFRNISNQSSKADYVMKYEVGISAIITANDIKIDAFSKLKLIQFILHIIRCRLYQITHRKKMNHVNNDFLQNFSEPERIKIFKQITFTKLIKSINISLFPYTKNLPPILKVMLFRDNIYNVNLTKVKRQIKKLGNYDISLIENHLKRTATEK